MTLEEQIRKEAAKLAEYMTKPGITTEHPPLSELSSVFRAFSSARWQVSAHETFEQLSKLFAEWAAKHPK